MEQQIKEFESLVEVLEELDNQQIYGFQRYKTVNRFVTMKARYNDIPVKGSFELTPLCNLDCKMCYVHLQPNQLGESERLLTVEEWKCIIQQAIDAGMIYASLTGGECLTYPGFKDIYLYLYSRGIQPDVLTNGRLLTDEMVSFFSKYPPAGIQVTLYGSNEDTYEAVTGHRVFQQVIDNIKRVKDAGLSLLLTVSPSRYMKNDVRALLDLVHSFDVPYAVGDTTLQAREETGRDIQDYAIDLETSRKIRFVEWEYSTTKKKSSQDRIPIEYTPKNRCKLNGLPCGGAHSSFHVNWRGQLCPCIGYAPSVHCDILDAGFSVALQQLRQCMLQFAPPSECQNCSLKEVCVTCPAEKTNSVLNGQLNRLVCNRVKQCMSDGELFQTGSCLLQEDS
ncbi:MAG: radical SAM protein [Clostridia bacterium]|nr:radical SAM protein [Clostridia bacterium]